VISLLAGSDLGTQAFLGAMVSYAVTGGVASLPQTVVAYRMRRLHEMLVTAPMKPLTYVLGLAVSRILYMAPPLVVVFAIFTVIADVAIWRVLLLVAVAWIIGSVLGFSIAKQWDNPAYISAVANMIGYLLVLLPPVYYQPSILPSEFHTIVLVIPTANIAQLARWITSFADISAMTLAAQGGLLALTVGLLVWFASRDTHWQQV